MDTSVKSKALMEGRGQRKENRRNVLVRVRLGTEKEMGMTRE